MGDDSNNYYSSYGNRNYGTGYMDPEAEKTSETEDRRIDNSAEQIGVELDSLLKSRIVLIKKWLLAVAIVFNVMLLLLLTTSILVGVMKLKSIKSKMQRLENENKVLTNYAEEWNLAIMQSLGQTNKVRRNFLAVFFCNYSFGRVLKGTQGWVFKRIIDESLLFHFLLPWSTTATIKLARIVQYHLRIL